MWPTKSPPAKWWNCPARLETELAKKFLNHKPQAMSATEMRQQQNRALSEAIRSGDATQVRRLVEADKKILSVDWGRGRTWLHKAAGFNNPEVVATLVDLGINPNVELTYEPETPLHVAVLNRCENVVGWLLENGADANVGGGKYPTPLSFASSKDCSLEIVKNLVESGAHVNTCHDFPPRNPLFLANKWNNSEIEQYLRANGALFPREMPEWIVAQQQRKDVVSHLERNLGPVKCHSRSETDPIEIWVSPPNEKRSSVIIATVGISADAMMPSPAEAPVECLFELPVDWPVNDEVLASEKFRWPVDWLHLIGKDIFYNRKHVSHGDTYSTKATSEPLGQGTTMSAILVLKDLRPFGSLTRSDQSVIQYLSFFPIYREELAFKEEQGLSSLIRAFEHAKMQTRFKPDRLSVC